MRSGGPRASFFFDAGGHTLAGVIDGMNAVFCGMLLAGVLAAVAQGNASAAQRALLEGGGEAISFFLSMAGAYAFFGGLMGVLRESGVTQALALALRRPLMRLFAFEAGEEQAMGDISVNLAANMLGMGSAATPAGLSAMRKLAVGRDGRGSNAMQLFLLLNMCSVQLLPTTMLALRAQAGAESPADIVLPTLLVTLVQAGVGVTLCKISAARNKKHG